MKNFLRRADAGRGRPALPGARQLDGRAGDALDRRENSESGGRSCLNQNQS